MTGKSQGEAVNILRGAKGVVKLVVQREEEVSQPSPQAAVEVRSACSRFCQPLCVTLGAEGFWFRIHHIFVVHYKFSRQLG